MREVNKTNAILTGFFIVFTLLVLARAAFAVGSSFVLVFQPIGITFNPFTNTLLYTQDFVSSPGAPAIFSVDEFGTVTVFAPTFPSVSAEKYLAVSPGLGGFPAGHVFVTQGQQIFDVTPDGSTVTLFATIPSPVSSHTGIAFDLVGTFNYDMIVTAANGDVFRIDHNGLITFLVNTAAATGVAARGSFTEGVIVAPLGFGPNGGQAWVTSEATGEVLAISPAGVVSVVATFSPSNLFGPETLHLIPSHPRTFGSSGGAYFYTGFPFAAFHLPSGEILKEPATDFAGLEGEILVLSEFGFGPAVISPTTSGLGYTVTPTPFGVTPPGPFGPIIEGATFLPFTGCTPGFWKNRAPVAWGPTGFSPTQTIASVFTLPTSLSGLGSNTLLDALSFMGGPTTEDAARILLRAGVAALLDAADPSVSSPLTTGQVISQVNGALASLNRDMMLSLASELDGFNSLGCPLP